jgi:hypothetical protein
VSWLVVSAWVSGCVDPLVASPSGSTAGDDGATTSGMHGDGDDAASLTSTSGTPPMITSGDDGSIGDGTDDEDDEGNVLFPYPDFDPGPFVCDLFSQDCVAGEKCMPWADDGGPAWNATRCSPLAANPAQLGDPCQVEGSAASGIDDCDIGLMCWDVDASGIGTCEDMCTGNAEAPICEDPADLCVIANDGAIVLCLPSCDPVAATCPGTQVCTPTGDAWVCSPAGAPQGGSHGQPCSATGTCAQGHTCVAATAFTSCADAGGCCSPFCDLNDDGADAMCATLDPAQACEPFYARPPMGYEHVGICAIPP